MNGRNRADTGWNVLLAVSIVVIFAAVFVGFYLPGNGHGKVKHQRSDVDRLADSVTRKRESTARILKGLKPRTWIMAPEALASSALDRMTALTQKNHLQLTEFRTDKLLEIALLKEESFSTVVEGRFVDVMTLLKTLEAPDSKLVVNVLQLSSSDNHSDRITANLSLAGFMLKGDVENNGVSGLARHGTIPPPSVGEVGELANREGGRSPETRSKSDHISQRSKMGGVG